MLLPTTTFKLGSPDRTSKHTSTVVLPVRIRGSKEQPYCEVELRETAKQPNNTFEIEVLKTLHQGCSDSMCSVKSYIFSALIIVDDI